jgi:hypothetical protein
MATKDQVTFVEGLLGRIRMRVMEQAAKWPENWDGIELCVLVENTSHSVAHVEPVNAGMKKRIADAKNEILVRNLI